MLFASSLMTQAGREDHSWFAAEPVHHNQAQLSARLFSEQKSRWMACKDTSVRPETSSRPVCTTEVTPFKNLQNYIFVKTKHKNIFTHFLMKKTRHVPTFGFVSKNTSIHLQLISNIQKTRKCKFGLCPVTCADVYSFFSRPSVNQRTLKTDFTLNISKFEFANPNPHCLGAKTAPRQKHAEVQATGASCQQLASCQELASCNDGRDVVAVKPFSHVLRNAFELKLNE